MNYTFMYTIVITILYFCIMLGEFMGDVPLQPNVKQGWLFLIFLGFLLNSVVMDLKRK